MQPLLEMLATELAVFKEKPFPTVTALWINRQEVVLQSVTITRGNSVFLHEDGRIERRPDITGNRLVTIKTPTQIKGLSEEFLIQIATGWGVYEKTVIRRYVGENEIKFFVPGETPWELF